MMNPLACELPATTACAALAAGAETCAILAAGAAASAAAAGCSATGASAAWSCCSLARSAQRSVSASISATLYLMQRPAVVKLLVHPPTVNNQSGVLHQHGGRCDGREHVDEVCRPFRETAHDKFVRRLAMGIGRMDALVDRSNQVVERECRHRQI